MPLPTKPVPPGCAFAKNRGGQGYCGSITWSDEGNNAGSDAAGRKSIVFNIKTPPSCGVSVICASTEGIYSNCAELFRVSNNKAATIKTSGSNCFKDFFKRVKLIEVKMHSGVARKEGRNKMKQAKAHSN